MFRLPAEAAYRAFRGLLGSLLPMTGGFAHVGPAEQAGLHLAVKDIEWHHVAVIKNGAAVVF